MGLAMNSQTFSKFPPGHWTERLLNLSRREGKNMASGTFRGVFGLLLCGECP